MGLCLLIERRWGQVDTTGPDNNPRLRIDADLGEVSRVIQWLQDVRPSLSNGVIVSGGLVRNSVLSPGVRVNSWVTVERSVLLHNSRVGRHAVVENAILDKNVVVMEGAVVGVDKERDRDRGFVVSSGGVTVVGKGQVVPP
jgi:ADP-glucose pyrophosphorylase